MVKALLSLTPKNFWELYSKAINNKGKKLGTFESYKNDKTWTKPIIKIAQDVIQSFYENNNHYPQWKVDTEYFNVDFIGYLTEWDNPNLKKQHDWHLKIAYEHENSNNWDDELCKLCHVVADLRVISSYHNFRDNDPIEELLQERVNRIGVWRLHRVPNSNWLFVFGPRIYYSDAFRAFTIDSELKVIEIKSNEKVIPANWN